MWNGTAVILLSIRKKVFWYYEQSNNYRQLCELTHPLIFSI